MPSRTEITARLSHLAARILADHPDGLPPGELWWRIVGGYRGVEKDGATAGTGTTTAEQNFNFYSIDLVKAGWLAKIDGRWHLTGIGRHALAEYDTPAEWWQGARDGNRFWENNRDRFQLVERLLAGFPEGHWVAVGDLASLVDVPADRIARYLRGARPEGWHLVLEDNGALPRDAYLTELERAEMLRILSGEGIDVVTGSAWSGRRIPLEDLRQLLDEEAFEQDADVPRRAWLIRGSDVRRTNLVQVLWLPEGVCSLPADRLPDLPPGVDRDQVKSAVEAAYSASDAAKRAQLPPSTTPSCPACGRATSWRPTTARGYTWASSPAGRRTCRAWVTRPTCGALSSGATATSRLTTWNFPTTCRRGWATRTST